MNPQDKAAVDQVLAAQAAMKSRMQEASEARFAAISRLVEAAGRSTPALFGLPLAAALSSAEPRLKHDRTWRGRVAKWLLGPHYPKTFDPRQRSARRSDQQS